MIVAPPPKEEECHNKLSSGVSELEHQRPLKKTFVFFYAATANSHKNFEILCAAAQMLYERLGNEHFEVHITVKGDENGYGRWLYHKWGRCPSIKFIGFLNREKLYQLYERADCLVFPSKIETWGLPITEFAAYHKPMLLTDLPYAYETASGCDFVSFFDPDNFTQLADQMQDLITGNHTGLKRAKKITLTTPVAESWHELFALLLK